MPQGYISSPQTTQGQSLTLAVTPKDAIDVDSEDETDFEILDSSDIQLSTFKFLPSPCQLRWWRRRKQGFMRVSGEWIHSGFCRYRNRAMNGKMVVVQNEADLILEG